MQLHAVAQRDLPGSSQGAFDLSLDPQRFPPTFSGFGPVPGLRRIRLTSPPAPGVVRDVESADGNVMQERITAIERPSRHAYVLHGLRPPMSWLAREGHAEWRFTPAGDRTHVSWRYRFVLTSPLAWPLAWPLLRVFMQGAMRRCLDAMAEVLAADARTESAS